MDAGTRGTKPCGTHEPLRLQMKRPDFGWWLSNDAVNNANSPHHIHEDGLEQATAYCDGRRGGMAVWAPPPDPSTHIRKLFLGKKIKFIKRVRN